MCWTSGFKLRKKKTLVSLFLLSLLSSTPTSQRFVVHCDTHFRLMLRSHNDDSFLRLFSGWLLMWEKLYLHPFMLCAHSNKIPSVFQTGYFALTVNTALWNGLNHNRLSYVSLFVPRTQWAEVSQAWFSLLICRYSADKQCLRDRQVHGRLMHSVLFGATDCAAACLYRGLLLCFWKKKRQKKTTKCHICIVSVWREVKHFHEFAQLTERAFSRCYFCHPRFYCFR